MNRRKRKRSAREILASNLRKLRAEAGLSQEALADQAGFHRTYVSHLENLRANITIDNLEQLAAFLGVRVHELLVDEGDAHGSARKAVKED